FNFIDEVELIQAEFGYLRQERFEEMQSRYESNVEPVHRVQAIPLRDIVEVRRTKPKKNMPPRTIKTNVRSRPRPNQSF
ncbi:MAG TPA: hypothetical protein VII94_01870, partial [Candidatus Saccharimonadales bacterium]